GARAVQTQSTWTVPVFGGKPADPCYQASGFADSSCNQAWRWDLDYALDGHRNPIAHYYKPQTHYHGRDLKPDKGVPYTRGGVLDHIDYGLRSSSLWPTQPPARIAFTSSERCIDTTANCDPTKIDAQRGYWQDSPWDLNCNQGQRCEDDHG